MRIIIVRHGETEANARRIIQGHADTPLSERGAVQAARLGARLCDRLLDAVYSSDLRRAQDTARAIVSRTGQRILLDPALRERSYGRFEGGPVEDFERALDGAPEPRENFAPEGGESLVDLERRVAEFLRRLAVQHAAQTVLLVGHAGTNRMILKIALQKSYTEWLHLRQDNACVSELLLEADGVARIVRLNCTAHLEASGVVQVAPYQ